MPARDWFQFHRRPLCVQRCAVEYASQRPLRGSYEGLCARSCCQTFVDIKAWCACRITHQDLRESWEEAQVPETAICAQRMPHHDLCGSWEQASVLDVAETIGQEAYDEVAQVEGKASLSAAGGSVKLADPGLSLCAS